MCSFGKVQLAAMGVLIGSADKFQNADLGSALQSIINEGGAPSINVVASNTMFYSHRHEGLVLQLARFLRPIWSIPVVRSTTPPLYTSTASQAELQTVQANLQGLSRYLDEMSYEGGHAYRDNQAVWQLEENSVADLRRLVQQAIEAISFILLLSDYKLPDIINSPK
jgi:nuclear pore complex protein Nup155